MSRRLGSAIACFAFLLLAAGGCGGDDGESESASQQHADATTETGTSSEAKEAEGGERSGGADREKQTPGDTADEAGGGNSDGTAGGGGSDGTGGEASGGTVGGDSGGSGGSGGTHIEAVQGEGQDAPSSDTGDDQWPPKDLVTVTIKNNQYSPQRVVVPQGGWIMWVNEETRTYHTATKTRGPSYAPDSPDISWGGDTYTDVFNARGEITYICTKHPLKMKGFITVK